MSTAITLLSLFAVVIYLIATITLTSRFFHDEGPRLRASQTTGAVAILLHILALYLAISAGDGQNMSIGNVLALVSWLMVLFMLIGSFYINNVILLPVIFMFAALTLALNALIPATYMMHIDLNPGLVIHITLSLFAYGTLMISLLYAIQLRYISAQLKDKKGSLMHSSLPPLMTVESILIKLVWSGFILLVIAVLSGALFLNDMFDTKHAHKSVLSIISLIVYAIGLIGYKFNGWRSKPLLLISCIGSILLTLAYFGSRLVREVILI